MKIVAIGDIHGRDKWKKVVEQEKDADMFVFIGDYLDNFPPHTPESIVKNFKEILDFKRISPEKVTLLLGNHEFHYTKWAGNDTYSGYNQVTGYKVAEMLDDAIEKKEIQIAYLYDDVLFTHAGVTKTWLNRAGGYSVFSSAYRDVADFINQKFFESPYLFRFYEGDRSGCGENENQSPIWVRPETLRTDWIDGFVQVVGHTSLPQITACEDKLVVIDAPKCGEYLVITDGTMEVASVDMYGKKEA